MGKFNPKLYEVLGRVSQNATQEEIKTAYRTLAKIYHPDKKHDDPEYAKEMMAKLNEAYEILSKPDKRAAYDLELNKHLQYQKWQEDEKLRQEAAAKARAAAQPSRPMTKSVDKEFKTVAGVGLGILALTLIIDALMDD